VPIVFIWSCKFFTPKIWAMKKLNSSADSLMKSPKKSFLSSRTEEKPNMQYIGWSFAGGSFHSEEVSFSFRNTFSLMWLARKTSPLIVRSDFHPQISPNSISAPFLISSASSSSACCLMAEILFLTAISSLSCCSSFLIWYSVPILHDFGT
jgi:hypothetical protein